MSNTRTPSVNYSTLIYEDDKYKFIKCIHIIAFIPCNYIYYYFHIVNCRLEHKPRMGSKRNPNITIYLKARKEGENVTNAVVIRYRLYLVLLKHVRQKNMK